jgi:hypothetical protein
MQSDRSAAEGRVAGTVRGLGVCDALRVELEPVQRAGLDIGLAARAAALEQRSAGRAAGVRADELADVDDALRLLARMRAPLRPGGAAPFVLVGPAGLVLELVDACLADAVARLAQSLGQAGACTSGSAAFDATLLAAAAWIATALDCRAVDGFCFEPGVDPVRAW